MNNYHIPKKEKWEFDESVTDIFDDMLTRSIPQYEVMRKLVTNIAINYIQSGSHVIDIGSSRGEQIKRLINKYGSDCHYHGIECSKPMIASAKENFKDFLNVSFHELDLRRQWLDIPSSYSISVCLSVLTLQFIPIEYRLNLLQNIYDSLAKGGCFLIVEKVIGSSSSIDRLMTQEYYKLKSNNGYSNYEIERKRLSLEGVLVPLTSDANLQLLNSVGFKQIDCFWRWMNFSGWIAIKN